MINLIKEYLLKLVDNIDAGNSNLTEDETIKLISVLKELTDRERRLSKYESCRYLNVSRAKHVKNAIWEFIGYSPQVDNDEVDAYLLTYIYIKILEVFRKHDKVVNR